MALLGLWMCPGGVYSEEAQPARVDPQFTESSELELIFLAEDRTLRVQLHVIIDDLSLAARWDSTFANLFAYFDRNNNGTLETDEAARLPTAFAIRQLLWGRWNPLQAASDLQRVIPREQQDVDAVTMAKAYRRLGIGTMVVAVGKPPASASLTSALLQQIDEDENGITTDSEWRNAEVTLLQLDRDDDELVEPSELRLGMMYPAAAGGLVIEPPRAGRPRNSELDSIPLIVLPAQLDDIDWGSELISRLDRDQDGRLNAAESQLSAEAFSWLDGSGDLLLEGNEMPRWRDLPADKRWTVRCSPLGPPQIEPASPDEQPPAGTLPSLVDKTMQLRLRGDDGTLSERNFAARQRFEAVFQEVDADDDGAIASSELEKKPVDELAGLLAIGDRDSDGRLSETELRTWLDLMNELSANQALLTLLDFGPALFELLDTDANGGLSIRELRGAWSQLQQMDCVVDNRFDPQRLPRHLSAIVSRGQPQSLLATRAAVGPAWFCTMDRNRDGVVSAREFLGTHALFLRCDHDRDGLLDSAEAEATSALRVAGEGLPAGAP